MFKVGDMVVGSTGRVGEILAVDILTGEYLIKVDGKSAWRKLSPKVRLYNSPVQKVETGVCEHHFKSYVGFTQCFDYCIHCDTKRNVK